MATHLYIGPGQLFVVQAKDDVCKLNARHSPNDTAQVFELVERARGQLAH
jgi:hypothetical protein